MYTFDYCSNLKSITFEENSKLNSIGQGGFRGCDSLTSLIVPLSVTSIGEYAFVSCSSLTSIEIPESVTNIGSEAFGGCYRLINIYYGGSEEQWNSADIYDFSELANVTMHFNFDAKRKYLITYIIDSDTIEYDELKYGDKISYVPVKDGYTFMGWALSEEDDGSMSFTMPSKDLTLYAKFIRSESDGFVIHYLRLDNMYTDWNLWLWTDDKDGASYNFESEITESGVFFEIKWNDFTIY